MKNDRLQNYLIEMLGSDPMLTAANTDGMPGYIVRTFSPKFGEILSCPVCFLFANEAYFQQNTIRDLVGAATAIQKVLSARHPVFVFDKISRRERQSLVRNKISFIAPDQQMFLPYLGIAFSEHIKNECSPRPIALAPVAQAFLIRHLLTGDFEGLTSAEIGKRIGYTTMSAVRAMEQVQSLNLCEIDFDGYRKKIHFSSDRASLWEKAKPFMCSPVKKSVCILDDTSLAEYPYAGEYALSKLSNLHAERKCFAVLNTKFNEMVKAGLLDIANAPEIGTADVEVWTYPPIRIGETVDSLSLELSFSNTRDARIRASLLEIKEHRKW